MIYIGVEAANSFVKVKSINKESIYLNTLKRVTSQREVIGGHLTKCEQGHAYLLEGESDTYLIGLPDGKSSTSRDTDRYSSDFYKRQMLFAISQHVGNGDDVIVGTGLPASHYENEVAIQSIKSLIGPHAVYIDEEVKMFNINEVKITLQPIGMISQLIFNQDGQLNPGGEEIVEGKKLIIDVGWGTTDIASMEGMELVKYDGIDTAILDAYLYAIEHLQGKYNELKQGMKTPFELDELYRNNKALKVRQREYDDFRDFINDAYKHTADEIVATVKSLGYTFSDYDYVIFGGGGAYALRKYLPMDNHIKIINDAQIANARGFYIASKFMG